MFPSLSAAEVHAATAERWDTGGPVPLPRGDWLACPVCRSGGPQVRWWMFHSRPSGGTVPWRCDVSVKCVSCACVWIHGVALDDEAWARRLVPSKKNPGPKISWRQVREAMEVPGGSV